MNPNSDLDILLITIFFCVLSGGLGSQHRGARPGDNVLYNFFSSLRAKRPDKLECFPL